MTRNSIFRNPSLLLPSSSPKFFKFPAHPPLTAQKSFLQRGGLYSFQLPPMERLKKAIQYKMRYTYIELCECPLYCRGCARPILMLAIATRDWQDSFYWNQSRACEPWKISALNSEKNGCVPTWRAWQSAVISYTCPCGLGFNRPIAIHRPATHFHTSKIPTKSAAFTQELVLKPKILYICRPYGKSSPACLRQCLPDSVAVCTSSTDTADW